MKTNRFKIRLFMLVTITSLLSLTALIKAQAAIDAKVYPGWMCRGQTFNASQSLRYNFDGSIVNINPDRGALVICPIVRDVLNTAPSSSGSRDILAVEKVTINFTNNISSQPINCTIDVRLGEKPIVRSQNASSLEQKQSYMHINMPKLDNNLNIHKAFYTMHCSLPARNGPLTARIHSYSVQETTSVF